MAPALPGSPASAARPTRPALPDRVLVYGVCGSGKSTLAHRLSQLSGTPWHSVDDLTWEPDWIPVPDAEQRARFERICGEDHWILDTAYSAWLDVALGRAQLIVALDYPRAVSLARLLRRTLRRLVDRSLICNGNRESLRTLLSTDSIIVWHLRTYARKRRRMRAWAADPSAPPVLLLTSPRRTRAWLHALSHDGASRDQ